MGPKAPAYAQSAPKVTPKWAQSDFQVILELPKPLSYTQNDLQRPPSDAKVIPKHAKVTFIYPK